MRLSRGERIALQCGPYTAEIAPAAGGRVASLVWREGGVRCPLLVELQDDDFDEYQWPKAGAFPMLPFANRLPREGFRFAGEGYRPQPCPSGFALHGIAHRRAWQVVDASSQRARLRLVHDPGGEGWPWPWTAEQDIELGAHGLRVTLTLRNDAVEPMPFGLGWHPYHPVAARLHFMATGRRELDAQGRAGDEDGPPVLDMVAGETAVFTGWDGRVQIPSTGAGTIAVTCQDVGALVVHRPATGDYLCAEPVTALPGWLGQSAADGVLGPAQMRTLAWRCGYERDRPRDEERTG